MFWHYVFSNNSALIEKLLEKEDVTLSELMEEEELLQECQAQNKKLVDFLSQDHILQELVSLVVTEPNNDKAYQVRFKQASIAAELLSAEVPAIVDKLAASESLLETLCNFLSNDKPLNPLLASFFSKVLGMLLHRRSEQNWYQYQLTCFRVLDFLKNHPDFIQRVTYHIGTSAIMNLLHKLMCGVEEEEVRSRIHAWVADTPLISLLVSKLGPENEWCEQASVEQLMCDVLDSRGGNHMGLMGSNVGNGGMAGAGIGGDSRDNSSHANSLLPLILNENIVQQLLNILLHPNSTPSSITHVTNILMKMLSIHSCVLCIAVRPSAEQEVATAAYVAAASIQRLASEESPGGDTSTGGSVSTDPSPPGGPEFCVARTVASVLPQIHAMLVAPTNDTVETSYGEVVERVGSTRLRLIALISALIETRHFKIHQTLAQLNTIPFIIDLLFKFPQNNFLHTLVERCVSGLLTKAAPCRTPPDAVLQETRRLARNQCLAAAAKADDNPAGTAESNAQPPVSSEPIASPPVETGDSLEKMEVSGALASSCSPSTTGANIPANNTDPPFGSSTPSATTTASTVPDVASSSLSSSSPSPLQIPTSLADQKCDTLPSDNKEGHQQLISTEHNTNTHSSASATASGDNVAPDEDSHPLLCQLIKEGRLIHRILGTYQFGSQTEPAPPPGSLCGYRGHVRNIANAVVDQCSSGDNASLLNALLQSLPSELQESWSEFQRTVLAEANAANAVTPLPGQQMLFDFDDSGDDEMRVFRRNLPSMLQNDNMLQISEDDMHLSFDENGFEAPANTPPAAAVAAASTAGHTSPTADFETVNSDGGSADLFEKLCRRNLYNEPAADDQFWDGKEQAISFAPDAHKVNEAEVHSSDDEDEADKEERTGGGLDTSMEVDELQDDWESVFDRRNSDPPASSAPRFTVPVPMPAPVPSSAASSSPSSAATPPADFNPWVKPPPAGGEPNTWVNPEPEQTSDPGWANFGSAAFEAPAASFASTNPFEAFAGTASAAAGSDEFAPFKAQFPNFESTEPGAAASAAVDGGSETAMSANSAGAITNSDDGSVPEGASSDGQDQELQSNFHFLSGMGALKPNPLKPEDPVPQGVSVDNASDAPPTSVEVPSTSDQEAKSVSQSGETNTENFTLENKQVDSQEKMEIDSDIQTISDSENASAAKVDAVGPALASEKDTSHSPSP